MTNTKTFDLLQKHMPFVHKRIEELETENKVLKSKIIRLNEEHEEYKNRNNNKHPTIPKQPLAVWCAMIMGFGILLMLIFAKHP